MRRRGRNVLLGRDPFDPLDGRIDDRLDLHGFTSSEARARLRMFIGQARKRSRTALLHVITGKGYHSAGSPVLRPLVLTLIRGELASRILVWGFDDNEGGYLIRLKR